MGGTCDTSFQSESETPPLPSCRARCSGRQLAFQNGEGVARRPAAAELPAGRRALFFLSSSCAASELWLRTAPARSPAACCIADRDAERGADHQPSHSNALCGETDSALQHFYSPLFSSAARC